MFRTALLCQLIVVVSACVIGTRWLRLPLKTVLLTGVMLNWIPVAGTVVLPSDLLVLAAVSIVVLRPMRLSPIARLATLTVVLWPLVGLAVSPVWGETDSIQSLLLFIFRRCGFVALLCVGNQDRLRGVNVRDVLDAALLVWLGMVVVGLLQYGGRLQTDFTADLEPSTDSLSVLESAVGLRGFLGLNRGAVGVCGATFGAGALALLLYTPGPERRRSAVRKAVAVVTPLVLLASGSRTGALAMAASAFFVLLVPPPRDCRRRQGLARLGAIAAAGGIAFLVRRMGMDDVGRILLFRWNIGSVQGGTVGSRLAIQRGTFAVSLSNIVGWLVGYGPSSTVFQSMVSLDYGGLKIPHSEYFAVLWQSGIVGLFLYLLLCKRIYTGLRAATGELGSVAIAGSAMLVAGLMSGLTVGHFLVTDLRLSAYGLFMAFVYGALLSRHREDGARPAELDQGTRGTPWEGEA